jgi:hypothetical protein
MNLNFKNLKTGGDKAKAVINTLFILVSCALLANTLVQISKNPIIMIIMGIVALGLDLYSQYNIASIKAYWKIAEDETKRKQKPGFFDWFNSFRVQAIVNALMYSIYAVVIIMATVGFAMSETQISDKSTDVYNTKKDGIIENIATYKFNIESLKEDRQNTTNKNEKSDIDLQINKNLKLKIFNENLLTNYSEVKQTLQKGVYENLAIAIKAKGVDANKIKMLMYMGLSIFIIFILIMTSWWQVSVREEAEQPEETPQEEDNGHKIDSEEGKQIIKTRLNDMLLYVDNIKDDRLKRLHADSVISQLTKLTLSDCQDFRKTLLLVTKSGIPVMGSKNGTSWINYTKEEIKDSLMSLSKTS